MRNITASLTIQKQQKTNKEKAKEYMYKVYQNCYGKYFRSYR